VSLSAAEIAAVVAELQPLLGSRVDGLRQHGERSLSIDLFGRADAATLLLSAEADLTRLHVASSRPPALSPPRPFQVLLRRELEGARLGGLTCRPDDRVVELAFDRGGTTWRLVAELTGRHGNLLLLDGGGVVRSVAARNLSQRRPLVAGQPYQPPALHPDADRDAGPLRLEPVEGQPFPLSAAVERRYAGEEAARRLAEARRRLREPLRAAVARGRRALEKLAAEAARVPAAEADRRLADLLKQNLHALRRGDRRAVLTEWTSEGPRQVTVALDPALPPRENMERIYRRYRRIVESAARVEARRAELAGRLERLAALLGEVDQAPPESLPPLEREARRLGAAPAAGEPGARRRREPERFPYRLFRSLSGVALLVGRGAADNDALTVRVARGNDLWLHVRGVEGAHVVARLPKGQGPDQDTLLDAAHLAAHFSDARGAPAADVAWTRARHVRKARGAAPGAVTYSQDRTLLLRLEPARLERLLASEEEAGGET